MDFANLDESHLIRLAQAGDSSAITELDSRYRHILVGFATNLIGNHADADDIAQSTLTKAFVKIDQFQLGSNFRSWLFQVARNTIIDRHRTTARYDTALAQKRDELVTADDVNKFTCQSNEIFDFARRRLTPIQYQAIWLKYVDQLDDAQIAERLNRSPGAVRVILSRARRTLTNFRVNDDG